MATVFGNESAQSTASALGINRWFGNRFTMADTGNVTEIHAYMNSGGSSGTLAVRAVCYDASDNQYSAPNNGRPKVLMGASDEVLYPQGSAAGWVTFTCTTPIALTPADYWLVLHYGGLDNYARVFTDTTGGMNAGGADTYAGGPANPCSACDWQGTVLVSIHAHYSPPATGKPCFYNTFRQMRA